MANDRVWKMGNAKAVAGFIATLALLGLAAGCGAEPTATPMPTSTPVPTPTATPTLVPFGVTPPPTPTPAPRPTPDTFASEWTALIAAARLEGEVVISLGGSESRYGRAVFALFEREFGVEVRASAGAGSESVNRLLAERARGIFTTDVATVSGGSLERLRLADALTPAADWLIQPDVIDRSQNWWLTETIWSDRDRKYTMADAFSVGEIETVWYNTENVTQEELDSINDYWDFTKPEFKGRIAFRAMNNPGGKSFIARLWLAPGLGPEFLDAIHRLPEPGLVPPEADDQLAEGVAHGKWDFGLFGGGGAFRALQSLQLPVRELTATKALGGRLATDISGGITMMGSPPNPNAAKLFANWWYTKEGQTAWIEARAAYGPLGFVSLRSDVPALGFPAHLKETLLKIPEWREEGTLEEHVVVFEENEEWFQIRDQSEKFFNDLYIELGYDAFVNY